MARVRTHKLYALPRLGVVLFLVAYCSQLLVVSAHAAAMLPQPTVTHQTVAKAHTEKDRLPPCHQQRSSATPIVHADSDSSQKSPLLSKNCCGDGCDMQNCHLANALIGHYSLSIYAALSDWYLPHPTIATQRSSDRLFRPPVFA